MGSSADSEPARISWLAQAEITDDQSIANKQGQAARHPARGQLAHCPRHNLKITDEFLNPNRAVPNGEQTRLEPGV